MIIGRCDLLNVKLDRKQCVADAEGRWHRALHSRPIRIYRLQLTRLQLGEYCYFSCANDLNVKCKRHDCIYHASHMTPSVTNQTYTSIKWSWQTVKQKEKYINPFASSHSEQFNSCEFIVSVGIDTLALLQFKLNGIDARGWDACAKSNSRQLSTACDSRTLRLR